jgi:8-oxo-dGTP diphosphatase
MEEAEVAGRIRQVCPACHHVVYHNPVPGAGILVEMDGGIVLIQRGEEPFKGWWALPAGYIEADESVEQAAIRECKEETGLDVELLELYGVGSFPEGPVQSGIIIFYRARPMGGELIAGDDAQDVAVFAPDSIPENLAFRTHREVVGRWTRDRLPQATVEAPEVSIREARLRDEESLLALLQLIPNNTNMTSGQRKAAAQRFREATAVDVLVAEADAEVVGFLAMTLVPGLTGPRAFIGEMAVLPDHRRRGIGASLVEAAIRRASQRGATHVLVDISRGDPAAQEFYQACGFEAGEVASLYIR